ncbi:hypothetical protein C8C96_4882 [Acidovorax sp. 100]|jgi:hypothetical protein|nr:hypothetical protein C8C96_4882 [Acidovorax sp. 100]
MSQRSLNSSESRSLREDQKAYLMKHRHIVTLEPHVPASEALYRTHRHGAVTIDRAMELDAIHDTYQAQQARLSKPGPQFDAYSVAEGRFIDQHGMSSQLD